MCGLFQVLALRSLPLLQVVDSIFGSGKIRVLRSIGQCGADWIEVDISRTREDPLPVLGPGSISEFYLASLLPRSVVLDHGIANGQRPTANRLRMATTTLWPATLIEVRGQKSLL